MLKSHLVSTYCATLFGNGNEWQKTEPVLIPLSKASSKFPMAKQETFFYMIGNQR